MSSGFGDCFLSAAQPTDQGEESIVLVVVVGGGDLFSSSHVQFFWGVKRQKLCLKLLCKLKKQ